VTVQRDGNRFTNTHDASTAEQKTLVPDFGLLSRGNVSHCTVSLYFHGKQKWTLSPNIPRARLATRRFLAYVMH